MTAAALHVNGGSGQPVSALDRQVLAAGGRGRVKTWWRGGAGESAEPIPEDTCLDFRAAKSAVQALIAFMGGAIPRIRIARLRLYASTCKLISVLTCGIVVVRRCVAPIQALSVPKGCSAVWRLILDARGVRISRLCIASSTFSCSHRAMRR
jgi:hypothetical protein